jgi:type I restriction enzyme, S subunit
LRTANTFREEHERLIKRCNPEYNDVLITKSGTIGRTAVVKTEQGFSLFVSVALIKLFTQYINADFVSLALENYINGINIQQTIKGGIIKNLHIEDPKRIAIPLAPPGEQEKIIELIKPILSLRRKQGCE